MPCLEAVPPAALLQPPPSAGSGAAACAFAHEPARSACDAQAPASLLSPEPKVSPVALAPDVVIRFGVNGPVETNEPSA